MLDSLMPFQTNFDVQSTSEMPWFGYISSCLSFFPLVHRNGERSEWSSTWEQTTSSSRRARWQWATANTMWCDSRAVVAMPRYRWTTSLSLNGSPQVGPLALNSYVDDKVLLCQTWETHWRENQKSEALFSNTGALVYLSWCLYLEGHLYLIKAGRAKQPLWCSI